MRGGTHLGRTIPSLPSLRKQGDMLSYITTRGRKGKRKNKKGEGESQREPKENKGEGEGGEGGGEGEGESEGESEGEGGRGRGEGEGEEREEREEGRESQGKEEVVDHLAQPCPGGLGPQDKSDSRNGRRTSPGANTTAPPAYRGPAD